MPTNPNSVPTNVASRQPKPIEEKETYRWLQSAEQCQAIKADCPDTQLVMVADRESDITEVIDYCGSQNEFDWVIRGGVDRMLARNNKLEASVRVRDQFWTVKYDSKRKCRLGPAYLGAVDSLKQHPSQADRDAREIRSRYTRASQLERSSSPTPGSQRRRRHR